MTLRTLEDEFVKCRAWGHEWEDFQPLRRRAYFGTVLSLRCARCSMERHDTINALGEVAVRSYVEPQGYKLSGEVRDRAGERLEALRRLRAGAKDRHPSTGAKAAPKTARRSKPKSHLRVA